MGIKHNVVMAGTNDPAKQASKTAWNDDHAIDSEIGIPVVAAPATPGANVANLFAQDIASVEFLAYLDSYGQKTALQTFLGRNKTSFASANGNSTTLSAFGLAITGTGTATAKNVATTGLNASMRGLDYLVTTAATTAVAGFRGAANQFWRGNAAGLGGFFYINRWAPATGVATASHRAFDGLGSSTAAPTDVEPSSQTNIIGMGWDAADANVQLMVNGTGTATKIDLGASFPVPTANYTNVYELSLFCPANGGTVYYEVRELVSGAVAIGSVSANLPAATTLLNPRGYCSAGGTSSVIGFTFFDAYVWTMN